jgi:hypothetical protein
MRLSMTNGQWSIVKDSRLFHLSDTETDAIVNGQWSIVKERKFFYPSERPIDAMSMVNGEESRVIPFYKVQ